MYSKVQIMDVSRAERFQRIRSFMGLPGLSFRLASGDLGLVNLTNAREIYRLTPARLRSQPTHGQRTKAKVDEL